METRFVNVKKFVFCFWVLRDGFNVKINYEQCTLDNPVSELVELIEEGLSSNQLPIWRHLAFKSICYGH